MWWVVKFKIPIAQVCGYHPRKLLFSYIQIFLFLKVTTFRKCSCLIFLYIIGYENIFRFNFQLPPNRQDGWSAVGVVLQIQRGHTRLARDDAHYPSRECNKWANFTSTTRTFSENSKMVIMLSVAVTSFGLVLAQIL